MMCPIITRDTEIRLGVKKKPKIIFYGRLSTQNDTQPKAELVKHDNPDAIVEPQHGPPRIDFTRIESICIDVYVRNAVSPGNFTIQNYRQSKNLQKLEEDMTSFYSVNSSEKILKFSNLSLGGYYAIKYKEKLVESELKETWVRCQIKKPFHEGLPILAYLTDHGIYVVTEANYLQPLKRKFLQLPVQAYGAKLHFIDLNQLHFTPEDCLQFRKEVEGKSYFGILVPQILENLTKSSSKNIPDDKLSIILVDTSSGKDVYLHKKYLPKKIIKN